MVQAGGLTLAHKQKCIKLEVQEILAHAQNDKNVES